MLVNLTQGFKYKNKDTLSARFTKLNDNCLLIYEPEFGGWPTANLSLPLEKSASKKSESKIKITRTGIDKDIPSIDYKNFLAHRGSIRILLHIYRNLEDRREKQRREIEILREHKQEHKWTHYASAALFVLAEFIVGFGINLITEKVEAGWVVFSAGVVITLFALGFTIWPVIFGKKVKPRSKQILSDETSTASQLV